MGRIIDAFSGKFFILCDMANVDINNNPNANVVPSRNFDIDLLLLPFFFMKWTLGNIENGYDQKIAAINGLVNVAI